MIVTGASQVRDVTTPPGSWLKPPAGSASPIFPGPFWAYGQTIATDISLFRGESGSTFKLYEFHSCALCVEVSHDEHFAKIPFMLLILEIALFQTLPKIHD